MNRATRQSLLFPCLFLLVVASFLACGVAHGKEVEVTSEWTLLGENDTIPAGVHVRMDMTTGEKWVKTIDEDDTAGDSNGAPKKSGSDSTSTTGMAVAKIDANGNVDDATPPSSSSQYDYDMMHRALSNLPPEEQERMGGIPEKIPEEKVASKTKITPEQRAEWERKMKEIWEQRQAELKNFQDDHLADLPQLLKDRIKSMREYLEDPISQLQSLDLDSEQDRAFVGDILSVLKDLEYQLTDVDMARDFYTLGGWPFLSSLMADAVHESWSSNTTQQPTLSEEDWNKVNLIQAHAAWVIGTIVKNTEEFYPFATAEVEVLHKSGEEAKVSSVKTTALDLVLAQFAASSKAVLDTTNAKDEYYDSVMMKVHKTLYALGALLRANRQSQTHFCADQGPSLLANVLSDLAEQKEGLSRDTLKVVQRLLALAQDIVMDATLHASTSEQVDEAIRKAFSSADWCSALIRFVHVPRLWETSLQTIQQLAPYCGSVWDAREVQRQVEWPPAPVVEAWLPEGLDEDLRKERMQLMESTLKAIQQGQKQ